MIKVYHRNDSKFGFGPKGEFPKDYTFVATVNTDDMEVAFERTNTIDCPWWKNEGLLALTPCCRSTSVGDVMVKDGVAYLVQVSGFARWDVVPRNLSIWKAEVEC